MSDSIIGIYLPFSCIVFIHVGLKESCCEVGELTDE